MAEYIEREAFIQDIQTEIINLSMDGMKGTRMPHDELYSFIDRIKEQPSADVVPVVRCKECEFHTFLGKCKVHSQEPDQYGPGHDVTMAPDDFCSYGKRKQLEE